MKAHPTVSAGVFRARASGPARSAGHLDAPAAGAIFALAAFGLAFWHVLAGRSVLNREAAGRFGLAEGLVFALLSSALFMLFRRLRRGALARAVARLRATNQTLNALIGEAPLGIVSLDRRGIVVSLNPAAERILGWRADEIVGRMIPFIPQGHRKAFWDTQAGVFSRGEVVHDLEVPMRRRDGSEITTSLSSAPIRDSMGRITGGIGIFEDVTVRKRSEETRHRYLALADSTQDIVFFARPDGRLIDANRAALLAYGYGRSELLRLAHHDLCAGACPSSDRADESLGEIRYEASHRRKGGEVFPVEVDRTVTVIDGETIVLYLVRDISERRSREATRALLHDFGKRILAGEKLDSILEFLCRQAARLHRLELVQISLKAPDGSLDIRAVGGPAAEFARRVPARWDDTPEGHGPTGTAVRSGEIAIVEVSSDPAFEPWRAGAEEFGLRVGMAVPLVSKSETVGALTVYALRLDVINPETVATLRSFADQVVLLLLSARDRDQIRLRTVALEATANAVMITDRNGVIRWVNPSFEALTGYTAEEAVGQTAKILRSGIQGEAFYQDLWKTIESGQAWRGELYNRRKDGSHYAEEQTITPVFGVNGEITNFIAVKQDISERRRHEEEIRFLALHDPLTKLPNRRSFEENLARAVARSARGREGAILLLDLDHFKVINDTSGHMAGDRLLVAVGELLQRTLRPADFLSRLGGDEFAVLVDDAGFAAAGELAERLRRAVDEFEYRVEGRVFNLSASIGISPVDGTLNGEAVMALVDAALYAAKEQGRNRIVTYRRPQEARLRLAEDNRWAKLVKNALKDDRFVLHFQPVVRLSDGSVEHVEALLRMRDEHGLLILPAEFLAPAERFGLMPQIDRWVFGRVLSIFRKHEGLRVFVNLSGASLGDPSFLDFVEERVRQAELPPGQLVFEVTETAAVADLAAAQSWACRLKDMGCRFALDDFGTGFSSFHYLQAIPADYVKIDASFVRHLDTSRTNRALVQAINDVSHALGKEVIAEAVESAAVVDVLRELSIEHGQGYYLGMPAASIPSLNRRFRATPASTAERAGVA